MAMAVWRRLFVVVVAMAATLLAPAMGKSVKNPADGLANAINQNLTASKLSKLYDSPGLACIALQYIEAYQGQCNDVNSDGKRPPDDAISSTFADNCGVDPTSVTKITGTVLACESAYKDPDYAFSNLLFKESTTLATLQNRNQTEFGVGISGYQGGAPYFWCVLFSNGSPSSSFTFVDKKAKFQKTGCFSGTGEPCSSSVGLRVSWSLMLFALLFLQT